MSDGTYAVKERDDSRPIATAKTQEEAIRLAHEARPGVKLDIELAEFFKPLRACARVGALVIRSAATARDQERRAKRFW